MSSDIIRDYVADAQKIIKKFPVEPFYIKKYQYGPQKAVWFIKTNDKNYALKRYALNKKQWDFMISAYHFLSNKNHNVAPLIYTTDNKPWVYDKDSYYILTNWVKGYPPDYTKEEDILMLTRGIANLHLISRNFTFPENYQLKDKYLGLWPEETRRKQGLLLEYKYEAEKLNTEQFSRIYLNYYPYFFELLEEAAGILESSLYKKWVKKIKQTPCLCVNGFSPQNFSLGKENKVWFLHLDNICYDLPARDLRKLIYKSMFIRENWESQIFSKIMQNYLKIYSLSRDELKITLAELTIPHLFINITTKYFLNKNPPKETFTSFLIKAIKLEKEKTDLLNRFWKLI